MKWTDLNEITQGRTEVRWRPGQEASLAHPCSNLSSFGSKCTALTKVLVMFLGLFGALPGMALGSFSPPPRYAPEITTHRGEQPLMCEKSEMYICWWWTYPSGESPEESAPVDILMIFPEKKLVHCGSLSTRLDLLQSILDQLQE